MDKQIFCVFALALLMSACKQSEVRKVDVLAKGSFPVAKEGELEKYPLNYVVNVEEWAWLDSGIVCTSSGTEAPFYCLDPVTLTVIDSVGKIGQGPEEFLSPHLIGGAHRLMIADNGRREIVWSDGTQIVRKVGLKTKSALNYPTFYSDSLICFIENYPNEIAWCLYNYETGKEVDRISFIDTSEKGKSDQFDFTYAVGKNYLAIAQLYFNQVFIYGMKDGKMEHRYTIQGNTQEGKLYYSNIICSGDKIYLLNQENVDLATETGKSRIEIFSLDGKPEAQITIPLIADRFLVDGKGNRILFLSPFDDDSIYTLSL